MKTKIFIILTMLSVLIFSCWLGEEKEQWYELTDTEKNIIPYEIGQTVFFIDSLGQSFYATVSNDSTYWKETDAYSWAQYRMVSLKFNTSNLYMELYSGRSIIYVYIYSEFKLFFSLSYNCNGNFYTNDKYENDKQIIHKSLDINNKIYYDVVEETRIASLIVEYGIDEKRMRSILYNKSYGILQVKEDDKVLFTIDN